MTTAQFFSGRVHSIIFENPNAGYYILRMILDGEDPVLGDRPTVRGNVPGINIQIGTWFGFEGEWIQHEQYGKQLSILKAPVVRTWTAEVAVSVLMANGVREGVALLLRTKLGDDLVRVLDAGDVAAFDGALEPDVAVHTMQRWRVAKAYFRTLDFITRAGISKNRISQVWSMFGDEAEEVLSENPWALVRIDGITFKETDEVAVRLGLDLTHPKRIEGAVRYTCKMRKGLGHLYLTTGDIVSGVAELVGGGGVSQDEVARAIGSLHKQKHLIVDRKTRVGITAVYEPWLHFVEGEAAELLCARARSALPERDVDTLAKYAEAIARTGPSAQDVLTGGDGALLPVVEAALRDWSTGSKVTLSEAQLVGARNALLAPVSILTGLPGSGKTTALKAIVSILRDAEIPFLLVAPTGIAAKRITAVTGAQASTIHRAFGAAGRRTENGRETTYTGITGQAGVQDGSDGFGEQWGGESGTGHPADVVVCDEASMVDQHLLYRILSCTRPTTRLVFIGDSAQLPSVGPGNVLRDLIASELFPTVSLTEIFRQADTSQIIAAAHAINRGDIPEVANGQGDFVFLPAKTEEAAFDLVTRIAEKLYEKREIFQVLSPRHMGTCGVTNLNSNLRERLNPKQPGLSEMKLGFDTIREGDRVMVVRNDYEREVFNGDTGKVSKLDRRTREVTVKIHGTPVQYVQIPFKDAPEYLRLAYAVTVHKSQGLEYDTVVMPMVNGFSHQLQRNLLYTAITRARKRVILVGHHEAMVRAIMNNRPDERNTLFLDRLRAKFSPDGVTVPLSA